MTIDWIAEATEYAKGGHSLQGPSTYPRLFRCPGSLRAAVIANARSKDTEFTIEGQRAHLLGETVLLDEDATAQDYVGRRMDLQLGKSWLPFTVDQEMADYVDEYVSWCRELPGIHRIEVRVDLSPYTALPDQGGRSDHTAIYYDDVFEEWVLCVTDLKYGKGEQVFAERNEQAMGYGLGAYLEYREFYDIRRVVIRICQPRLDHNDVWECSIDELMQFAEQLHEVTTLSIGEDAPCVPGDKQCRFCPVSGNCGPERQMIDALVESDFDTFDEVQRGKPVELLSGPQLANILQYRDFVRGWIGKIEGRALDLLMRDENAVPDLKPVEGTSQRRWIDDEKAEIFLRKNKLTNTQITKSKLISPAQAEKLLPKAVREQLGVYTRKPPGKPTLASLSDKRPVYRPLVDEFDSFDTDDEEDDF